MKNITKKYSSKYKVLRDGLGHEVMRTYVRKNRGATTVSLPYFYCTKCKAFFEVHLVEQTIRGKIKK